MNLELRKQMPSEILIPFDLEAIKYFLAKAWLPRISRFAQADEGAVIRPNSTNSHFQPKPLIHIRVTMYR